MRPLLLLALTISLLTGCLPTSVHPLSSIENATPEERLAGTWYGKSGQDQIFLHFVQGQGADLQIVEVDHEKKGTAHTTLYHAFPSEIGGNHYLNVREGDQEAYYFVRYQLKGNVLNLSLMSEASVSKAIAAHKLAGKITGTDNSKEIKITDSTAHLSAFVSKGDPDQLFDQKFGTFKRVTLPSFESPESDKKATPSKHTAPVKKKKKKRAQED